MKRYRILFALPLLLAGLTHAAQGITLEVWVEQSKSDEMPWDGCPHTFASGGEVLGGLMGNPFQPSPPEIQLLLLRQNGAVEMHPNRKCNDILHCVFPGIGLGDEVLGVLLFDADVTLRDLIDAAVLVPEKSPRWEAAAEQMKARVQTAVAQFTPEGPNLCKIQVAPREVKIHPLGHKECPVGVSCTLSQSSWSYERGALPQKPGAWDW